MDRLQTHSIAGKTLAVVYLAVASVASAQDCNNNLHDDALDVSLGDAADCNANGIPDECDIFPVNFFSPADLDVGANPEAIVAADLDSDGDLDLAVVNGTDDAVSVLLNDGTGTFLPPTDYAVDSLPASIAVADLDGDGHLDLITTNSGSATGSVSVLLNRGDGTFRAATHFDAFVPTGGLDGVSPVGVATSDFDNDGDIDVAVSNEFTLSDLRGSVTILLNDGTAALTATSELIGGESPRAVVAADLDGDGLSDLATANGSSADVSVFLNAGGGMFAAPSSYTVGSLPSAIAAPDVDGDGNRDLVTTNRVFDGGVSVLRNLGNGTFADAETFGAGRGNPHGVAPADLNGDGHVDLAVLNPNQDSLVALVNDGTGAFPTLRRFSPSVRPSAVVAGDWDGDGNVDIATANDLFPSSLGRVTIFFNVPPQSVDLNADSIPDECGQTELFDLLPSRGGDEGTVTVFIAGEDFVDGADVRLTRAGEGDIHAEAVAASVDGTLLSARFDLTGRARGEWSVVIRSGDSDIVTLADTFTIEASRGFLPWTDILGRSTIRAGREQLYAVLFGNTGNIDGVAVPLSIDGIPPDATWTLDVVIKPPPTSEGDTPIDFDTVDIDVETSNGRGVALVVSRIPPEYVGRFNLRITVPDERTMTLHSSISGTLLPSSSGGSLRDHARGCLVPLVDTVLTSLGIPGLSCIDSVLDHFSSAVSTIGEAAVDPEKGPDFYSTTELVIGAFSLPGDCGVPVFGPVVSLVLDAVGTFNMIKDCLGLLADILREILSVLAFDPNEIVGPSGAGEDRYVTGSGPFHYVIFFENLESASAPAQEVIVTDSVDPDAFDLTTLSFGPLVVGDITVTPPSGSSTFTETVDLRPDRDLLLKIDASLDTEAHLLTWRFRSIDPNTGLLPDDPLAGFLPPNVNHPEGEGSVSFMVLTHQDLSTGTEIENDAAIVFDVNEPILTNRWINVIDQTPPTSQVDSLASTQSSTPFTVSWSATDEGSGVDRVTILVSENGGPFTELLSATTELSTDFEGRRGSTYAFYSIARDRVGHVEADPPEADATTRVQRPLCGVGALPTSLFILLSLQVLKLTRGRYTLDPHSPQ